jgi:chemotaxis signal transduction protein
MRDSAERLREPFMIEAVSQMAQRAAELRREFDRGFAAAPSAGKSASHDVLAIRLDEQRFALQLSDIAGLFADKKITPVPGGSGFLLGIAGFRGVIAAVYDLQRLLGGPAVRDPRWLVMASSASVGFAFTAFDGQLRVPASAITPQQKGDAQSLTSGVFQHDGVLRPIIELSRALKIIQT